MASMTSESSSYFKKVAGEWDQIRQGYFGEEVRESAIRKAYLRPEMAVADVGAGTGFLSAGLSPLVRRVYVVDGSAEMLAVARKNLAEYPNIEFHEADGLSLPFPDESLDVVFANMYLHHCEDPLAAIREMARVLRPGGRLVITDLDAHSYAWLKDEMADVWQGFDRRQVREWFRQAGLVNVVVDCTGQSCCAQQENAEQAQERSQAKISVFVAAGTVRMAMREKVRLSYGAQAEAQGCCGGQKPADASSKSCCGGSSSAEADESSGCCGKSSQTQPATSEGCCGSSSSSSNCCSGNNEKEVTWGTGYSSGELTGVPQDAAEFSLGCGNPTAMANLRQGERVLDIGSGGGLDAFIAARKVGAAGRVIGVDMTRAMLERARASAKRNGITNVEFRQGFAEELPVEDGAVDIVMSNCVINLSEDKGQVFREAFRVLSPGGRLEVSDVVSAESLPFDVQMDPDGWAGCLSGALPEQEYLDLVAQAGFTQVQVRQSATSGAVAGVPVYSVIVSARKPDTQAGEEGINQTGCGPGCGCC